MFEKSMRGHRAADLKGKILICLVDEKAGPRGIHNSWQNKASENPILTRLFLDNAYGK